MYVRTYMHAMHVMIHGLVPRLSAELTRGTTDLVRTHACMSGHAKGGNESKHVPAEDVYVASSMQGFVTNRRC